MKDCFKSYKDKYKKSHTKSMPTGFGLTPADWKLGITTIEDKLEPFPFDPRRQTDTAIWIGGSLWGLQELL
jgi:hypothetical protein